MNRRAPIPRRTPLRRSTKPIRRVRPLWKGRKPRTKTGGQPPQFDTWRKQAKRGHEMWRVLVYLKEPSGICPMCRARKWTDAAHIFPKGRYPHVRLEPENGAPLCRRCHGAFDSDHELHREFAMRYMGSARYEALRLRAISRSKTDMGLMLLFLRQELERLRPAVDGLGAR